MIKIRNNLKRRKTTIGKLLPYFSFISCTVPAAIFTTSCWLFNNGNLLNVPKNVKPIHYNQKYDENNKISKTYKYGHLSFTEYPYGKDEKGNYLYFLGEKGLRMLSEEFLKRANFGPEINEISNVYINKYWDNIDTKNLNGFYKPNTKEISLFIENIVKSNKNAIQNFNNIKLEYKIEMILPTLVHEYTHHISNVYNDSGSIKDINYNKSLFNKLAYYNPNFETIKKTFTSNTKFLNEFKNALSYNDDFLNKYAHKNLFPDLNPLESGKPLFKDFSSAELFKIANSDPANPYDIEKLNLLNINRYYFNNSKYNPLKFTEPINESRIDYLYSFEELVPRELMKMSYATSKKFINKYSNDLEGMLFFKKASGIYITAYGEDILRNISLMKKPFNYTDFIKQLRIISPNWVFDRELKKFIDKDGKKTFANIVENEKLKSLFKAYVDLIGYGLPVSYFSFSQNNYKNANIGGYLDISKDDLNKKQSLIFENGTKKFNLNINISKTNLIAKKQWNSFIEDENWNQTSLLGLKNKYSYISNDFNINEFKNNFSSFNLYHWIDKNNNGIVEEDEKQKLNNSESFIRQNEIKRSIINSRKFLEQNKILEGLNNSYIFNLENNGNKYTFKKYEF